jgi:hypothetical protein
MGSLDQFPLEAEISLTEFRSEEKVTSRLQTHHRLRVRRRSELVGVLLDIDEWQHLVQHVARLEAEAEQREDEAVHSIIAARASDVVFEPGSPERVSEIDRDYERLVTEHAKSAAAGR